MVQRSKERETMEARPEMHGKERTWPTIKVVKKLTNLC